MYNFQKLNFALPLLKNLVVGIAANGI